MIIEPIIRNGICLTSHPTGCMQEVSADIEKTRRSPALEGPPRVLIIGSSTGYGLAARIVAAFGVRARTVGVAFERPANDRRPGTAGWYNTEGFGREVRKEGIPSFSVNGDAYSKQIKKEVIELIEKKLGQVDLILYSLAAPRRQDPATGQIYSSVIKPVGGPYTTKTVDFKLGIVSKQTLPEANAEEIDQTVRVMGGEDWRLWIQACRQAGILAPGSRTVAFSYIGPAVTYPIYREGTIGRAKENLEATAKELDKDLSPDGGSAVVSVNKAVVTRASSVIPAVPLYLSLLYRVMKDRDLHETCLQQMRRLFKDYLAPGVSGPLDGEGRIRLDDRELSAEVQDEVSRLWEEVRTENLEQISDIEGFKKDFYRLHGFAVEGVDYEKEVSL